MDNIKFANYGQERGINATDEEIKIFEILKDMTGIDKLRMVRKSDSYVTAGYRGWDLARFKYTPRAKWIAFPSVEAGPPKHRIEIPDGVRAFEDLLTKSLKIIEKYEV